MQIIYSPQFKQEYRKLSDVIKRKAEKKEKIFRANPIDNQLKTHKLGGRFTGLWSFSIDYRYRIIFEFTEDKKVIFHTIGDHSLYKKL